MHYGNHWREAFVEWVDHGMLETAEVEVDYEPQQWPARRLLGRMTGCTDIMPSLVCTDLDMERGSTYAAAAQRLLAERAKTPA